MTHSVITVVLIQEHNITFFREDIRARAPVEMCVKPLVPLGFFFIYLTTLHVANVMCVSVTGSSSLYIYEASPRQWK
jgi:hypothetical protein